MRKLISYFIMETLCLMLVAQTSPPPLISYQGIVRDAAGNVLSNKPIAIEFIIHKGNATGVPVFTEQHQDTTNNFGLFTLEIGKNNPSQFQSIDWNDKYFLEVRIDTTGMGSNFVTIGTQQILSVPYALYSAKAKVVDSIPDTGTKTAWTTEGNYQTDSIINFLGTKDNRPLIFKTSNMERMRITQTGKIRIGNTLLPPKALVNVFGSSNDTVLAHFSNTGSAGSLIDIYNLLGGYSGISMRSGIPGQDTGFVGMKQNDNFLIYSSDDIFIVNKDSLKLYGEKNTSLYSSKNVNIGTSDTIGLFGRTRVNYTATLSPSGSNTDNALTINFANNQSNAASGIKVNHFVNYNNNTLSSFGMYINNNAVNTSTNSTSVGLGSYSMYNGGRKRGIDIGVSGTGQNIGLFLDVTGGNYPINGYSNWSIYSNRGNVMLQNGHLVSSSTGPNFTPTLTTFTSFSTTIILATLDTSSTDTKGIISYNMSGNPLDSGKIIINFGTPYFKKPVVIFTYSMYSGNGTITLGNVTNNYFELEFNLGSLSTNIWGEVHYFVIE